LVVVERERAILDDQGFEHGRDGIEVNMLTRADHCQFTLPRRFLPAPREPRRPQVNILELEVSSVQRQAFAHGQHVNLGFDRRPGVGIGPAADLVAVDRGYVAFDAGYGDLDGRVCWEVTAGDDEESASASTATGWSGAQ